MKRILLVEDYEEKANNILAFLKQEFTDYEKLGFSVSRIEVMKKI